MDGRFWSHRVGIEIAWDAIDVQTSTLFWSHRVGIETTQNRLREILALGFDRTVSELKLLLKGYTCKALFEFWSHRVGIETPNKVKRNVDSIVFWSHRVGIETK